MNVAIQSLIGNPIKDEKIVLLYTLYVDRRNYLKRTCLNMQSFTNITDQIGSL